jgi:hypothetical protein
VSDTKHRGCPARWGAQTWDMGDRAALAVQNVRELIAGALSLVPGWEAEAPPTQRAADARARAR